MAKSAVELADLISELTLKDKQRAEDVLRAKCMNEIEEMIKLREYDCTVVMDEKDLAGLDSVTAELRELGYKFRFIERQKPSGDTLEYRLLISIHHCK